MKAHILENRVRQLRKLLATEPARHDLCELRARLCAADRDLALLKASATGAFAPVSKSPISKHIRLRSRLSREFQETFENSDAPYLLLDPRPGLHIVEANAAYAIATMTDPSAIAGDPLFDVFPDNPDDPIADGVSNLYNSLAATIETETPQLMAIQRYDIRTPSGAFVVRYWWPENTPVFDEDGSLVYLLHHVEDVTGEIETQNRRTGDADTLP